MGSDQNQTPMRKSLTHAFLQLFHLSAYDVLKERQFLSVPRDRGLVILEDFANSSQSFKRHQDQIFILQGQSNKAKYFFMYLFTHVIKMLSILFFSSSKTPQSSGAGMPFITSLELQDFQVMMA